MKQHFFILLTCFFVSNSLLAQYTMSNQTVYDCVGTLTDSEANTLNPGWYTNNENYAFTICTQEALSITVTFNFFQLDFPACQEINLSETILIILPFLFIK